MPTLFIYFIGSVAISFYIYRVRKALKEDNTNLYLKQFYYAILFIGVGEILGLALVVAYLLSQYGIFLYILDILSRTSLSAGSIFLIQIPLSYYFPKFEKKKIISYVLAFLLLGIAIYNCTLHYQPFLDSEGFIHWEAPMIIKYITSGIFIAGWILPSLAFFDRFIRTEFKSKKSFFLGAGFFLGALGSGLQDFAVSSFSMGVLYLLLLVGVVLLLLGFLKKENSTS